MSKVTGIAESQVLPTYTVATLPDATRNTGMTVAVSDGAAGSFCVAISNGTNWVYSAAWSTTCATS